MGQEGPWVQLTLEEKPEALMETSAPGGPAMGLRAEGEQQVVLWSLWVGLDPFPCSPKGNHADTRWPSGPLRARSAGAVCEAVIKQSASLSRLVLALGTRSHPRSPQEAAFLHNGKNQRKR